VNYPFKNTVPLTGYYSAVSQKYESSPSAGIWDALLPLLPWQPLTCTVGNSSH